MVLWWCGFGCVELGRCDVELEREWDVETVDVGI